MSLLCNIFLVLLDYLEYYNLVNTCTLVGSCILNANISRILHWLCVGHAIDLCVGLYCIACLDDHLLAKCSL